MIRVVDEYKVVDISDIRYKFENPRKIFHDEEMEELISSIRESGILSPIWCGEDNVGLFLIAGDRRLRAANEIGLTQIPCKIFRIKDEADVRALQMIENEQRSDLTQKERFHQLKHMRDLNLTVTDMSKMTGLNPTTIRGLLDLGHLKESIFERTDIDDFAKTQIAKLESDEQDIITEKLANEKITARQLYEDVLRNLRRLQKDDSLSQERRTEIRAKVILDVDRDIRAERIIQREKIITRMRAEGKIPRIVDDRLVEKYIEETDKYHRVVMEMIEAHVEVANPSLVSKLGSAVISLSSALQQLLGRVQDE